MTPLFFSYKLKALECTKSAINMALSLLNLQFHWKRYKVKINCSDYVKSVNYKRVWQRAMNFLESHFLEEVAI